MKIPTALGPPWKGTSCYFFAGLRGTPNAGELILPMVEQAQKQEIQYIVFIASHSSVAEAIEKSAIDYSFISANFFMENFEMYQTEDICDRRQIFLPCGDGKASFIHGRDIGEVAAELLADPPAYRQETLSITGPESLDMFEAAAIFSEVLGAPVTYKNPDEETYRRELESRDYSDTYINSMIEVFGQIKEGVASETSPMVEHVLRRAPLSLNDYIDEKKDYFQPG